MSVISPAQPLQVFLPALAEVQRANYASASALAFLAYDICATFPDEVEYMWSSKWSLPKVTYFFTRYYSLIYMAIVLAITTNTHLTAPFCKGYFWYFFFGGQSLVTTAVDIIFILRIHALYNRSVKILIFLVSMFLVGRGLELWICVVSGMEVTKTVSVNPLGLPWPGCVVDPISNQRSLGLWIFSTLFAFTFFALTMFKFRDQMRDNEGRVRLGRLMESKFISPLLTVFVRDGTVFFLLIFATLLISTVLTVIHQGAYGNQVIFWLMAIYSFAGTHLVLNMRASSRIDPHSSTRDNSVPLQDIGRNMVFARPKPIDSITGTDTTLSA